MSLIAELKRRQAFNVGSVYLVVGWLLIQVATTIAPQQNLSEWAPRLSTFVILPGLPIAILLAWLVDLTPDRSSEKIRSVQARASSFAFRGAGMRTLSGEHVT
ncbi:MAG: hypothetical protein ABI365_06700 [Lysobacteraceae bacterium]